MPPGVTDILRCKKSKIILKNAKIWAKKNLTISSGDKIPNWMDFTVRTGATLILSSILPTKTKENWKNLDFVQIWETNEKNLTSFNQNDGLITFFSDYINFYVKYEF